MKRVPLSQLIPSTWKSCFCTTYTRVIAGYPKHCFIEIRVAVPAGTKYIVLSANLYSVEWTHYIGNCKMWTWCIRQCLLTNVSVN